MRTSTCTGCGAAQPVDDSPSCSTRSSFACSAAAARRSRRGRACRRRPRSKRPSLRPAAPVKAPFSWPNSSDSSRLSGMAAQLTATNGPAGPRRASCMSRRAPAPCRCRSRPPAARWRWWAPPAAASPARRGRPARSRAARPSPPGSSAASRARSARFSATSEDFSSACAHALHHRLPLERLGDEVVGAFLHGGHRRLDGAVGGHQHHLDLRRDGLERAQQRLAAHPRHHQVGDHHRGVLAPRHLERLGAATWPARRASPRARRSSRATRGWGARRRRSGREGTRPQHTPRPNPGPGRPAWPRRGGWAPKAWRSSAPKTATAPPAASARKPTSRSSSASPCREGGAGCSVGVGDTVRRCDGGSSVVKARSGR